MFRRQRLTEIILIPIIEATVSILKTLWLKSSLLKEIEKIAKIDEPNILRKSGKVTLDRYVCSSSLNPPFLLQYKPSSFRT